jgi:hypothetical protein
MITANDLKNIDKLLWIFNTNLENYPEVNKSHIYVIKSIRTKISEELSKIEIKVVRK